MTVLFVVTSFGLAIPMVAAVDGWAFNYCPFKIYTWTDGSPATCPSPPCSSEQVAILPDGNYNKVPFRPVENDAGGVTVKFSKAPNTKYTTAKIYQAEYSVRNGRIWYNFSHVDGSPLQNFTREMWIGNHTPGTCDIIHCASGSANCDWYVSAGLEYNVHNCNADNVGICFCCTAGAVRPRLAEFQDGS